MPKAGPAIADQMQDLVQRRNRVGFLPAETCFCHASGLNWFKPAKTWFKPAKT